MLVYLAHPIDQDTQPRDGWFVSEEIKRLLIDAGLSIYHPGAAFHVKGADDLDDVDSINRTALATCDAVVAWLPPGVPTLGVPAEIEWAVSQEIPCVIFTTTELIVQSVQLASWRTRGAKVAAWDGAQAKRFREVPSELRDLLRYSASIREDILSEDAFGSLTSRHILVNYIDADAPPTLTPGVYVGDAGVDMAISETVTVPAGGTAMIKTGARVAIPDGYFGWITGRSSTWHKYQCRITPGIIDSGYRGELMISLVNESSKAVQCNAGARLAQLIILPTFAGGLVQVDDLPESHRGTAGYGSSGQ